MLTEGDLGQIRELIREELRAAGRRRAPSTDPLEGRVADAVRVSARVTVPEVMTALGLEGRGDAIRVGVILGRLGFVRRREGAGAVRRWYHVRQVGASADGKAA